jgi:hypothetical protein
MISRSLDEHEPSYLYGIKRIGSNRIGSMDERQKTYSKL